MNSSKTDPDTDTGLTQTDLYFIRFLQTLIFGFSWTSEAQEALVFYAQWMISNGNAPWSWFLSCFVKTRLVHLSSKATVRLLHWWLSLETFVFVWRCHEWNSPNNVDAENNNSSYSWNYLYTTFILETCVIGELWKKGIKTVFDPMKMRLLHILFLLIDYSSVRIAAKSQNYVELHDMKEITPIVRLWR